MRAREKVRDGETLLMSSFPDSASKRRSLVVVVVVAVASHSRSSDTDVVDRPTTASATTTTYLHGRDVGAQNFNRACATKHIMLACVEAYRHAYTETHTQSRTQTRECPNAWHLLTLSQTHTRFARNRAEILSKIYSVRTRATPTPNTHNGSLLVCV